MFSRASLLHQFSAILLLLFFVPAAAAQCPHAGKNVGSIPYPPGGPYQGVSFRVWAPNADAAAVAGDFNGWSATQLIQEGNTGFWCKDVPGATVGQQYDYLIHSQQFGTVIRRDPNSRTVTAAHGGKSIIYDPAAYSWQNNFSRPPLNKLVIYEMYVGTFNVNGSSPGTFQSAIERLDDVSSAGFNAIEVLPVTQFDGVFGNPYGPTDQDAVDTDANGGPNEFKAFVDACHQRGMAVIVDVVHNHWGPFDIPTFKFDGWHTSLYPGGIYYYDANKDTDPYDSPWGPRPNYSNPVVYNYIASQIAMWFNEYHADGLRWDSVSNIYNTWGGGVGVDPHTGKAGVPLPDGKRLLQQANSQWPATYRIAEDLSFSQRQASDTLPVSQGGLGFDSQWNGTFAYYIRKDFPQNHISLSDVVSGMTSTFNNDPRQSVTYFESHNELSFSSTSRLIELIDPNNPTSRTSRKKASLAAALLFTVPEVPMIFQGDEFLDTSWSNAHSPLNWQNAQTWAGIHQLYADTVSLRTDAMGRTPGLADKDLNMYQQDKTNNVLVYDRYDKNAQGQDDVIVVANLSPTVFDGSGHAEYKIGLPYGGNWNVVFNSDSQSYSSDFGNIGPASPVKAIHQSYGGQPYSATIPLGDYSVIILTQK